MAQYTRNRPRHKGARQVIGRGFYTNVTGATVLAGATLWLDTARSVAAEQAMVNGGTGGAPLNAQYGTGVGVDASDPKLLTHTGTNYLYLPGVGLNSASIPDPAWLAGATSLDVRVAVAMDDWTPAAAAILAAQGTTTAAVSSFRFSINTAGALTIELVDGAVAYVTSGASTVNLGATADGGLLVVRVTFRGSDGRVQFFSKATTEATAVADTAANTGWTQLGTDKTAAATVVADSSVALTIGGYTGSGTSPSFGKFYAAWIATTIDGTAQANINFTANTSQTSFTESSTNAATVTINRGATGRKSVFVTRPVLLFGTDDYLEVADNALLDFDATDSFTLLAVSRFWSTTNDNMVISKKASGAVIAGYWFRRATSNIIQFIIDDGAVQAVTTTPGTATVAGTAVPIFGIRDVASDNIRAIATTAGTTIADGTTASLANAIPFRVGMVGAVTVPADMELFAVAAWRRALSAAEIAAVQTYYAVT